LLKVVTNSSPLICLARIGHLDLLKFFDEIIVPEAVYNEIRDSHKPHALCEEFVFGHAHSLILSVFRG